MLVRQAARNRSRVRISFGLVAMAATRIGLDKGHIFERLQRGMGQTTKVAACVLGVSLFLQDVPMFELAVLAYLVSTIRTARSGVALAVALFMVAANALVHVINFL